MGQDSEDKPLIIISGPTAVGKTDISIMLAKSTGAQIISADSMQVYKGFDIGTAKISQSEMQGIKHYMINELEPDEEFNVFEFQRRSKEYIKRIYEDGQIPMIVGGTGFYIQALLYDVEFAPSDNPGIVSDRRRELEELARTKGASYLHAMLEEKDPLSAAVIHENNIKRTVRALEFYYETGQKISEHNLQQRQRLSEYNFIYFVLNRRREEIYRRIDLRVDQMMKDGLVEEVKKLLDSKVSRDSLAMQGLGYKEIAAYLAGEISFDEAVYIIKRDTRHFAKRQLTWYRREKEVTWIDYDDFSGTNEMAQHMIGLMKEKRIIKSDKEKLCLNIRI